MKITSKQWREFKEYRKIESQKICDSEEYARLTKRKLEELNVRWPSKINFVCVDIFSYKRDALFSHIPDLTIENCHIWLLDNNKIK